MSWEAVVSVVFVAFVGGLLLISRIISWVAGLVLILKSPTTGPGDRAGSSLAQVLLHSGPWSLALAIGVLWYAASLPEETWLWAVLGGFGLASALLTITIVVAHLRQRRGTTAPIPLTPERLLVIRRRYLWGTTIFYGGSMSAGMVYAMWPQSRDIGLAIILIGICLAGGYGFAWFMWQFQGAALQAREDARRRAEKNNAV